MPEKTCGDLHADCGFIRNSCNIRLNCGACNDPSKECDPDTNTCVACENVSCDDLGYECGAAWLGCGPQTNLSNCGDCATKKPGTTCNPILHVCEPTCTPMPTATICAAAKAAGMDCGIVTNNCGGVVDCGGCPAGEGCGIRGVANQCSPAETPLECQEAGLNCGDIPSLCGGTVNCGICPSGQVCNSNHICGPACTPKDCSDPAYAGKCGVMLDDGCLGKIPSCGCTGGKICSTIMPGSVGMCGMQDQCSTYNANGQSGNVCSNGGSAMFPKGDGTNLTCPCTQNGAVCVNGTTVVSGSNSGTCCVNDQVCGATDCGITKTNKCTGAVTTCNCTGNNYCDMTAKTCKPTIPCSTYNASGGAGNPCSVNATVTFDKGGGVAQNCPCNGGRECTSGGALVTGTNTGTCCTNTNPTCGTKCDGSTVTDSCTGVVTTCNGCGGGKYCSGGTCTPYNTCPSTNPAPGATCSNGNAFDRGDGTLIPCKCPGGYNCYNGTTVVSGATKGTCCGNPSCGNSCATSVTNCDGSTTACNCNSSNSYCNGGTCAPLKTCSQLAPPKTGAINTPCSNNPAYDAGGGVLIACPCDNSGGKTKNQCVSGTCACTPDTCGGDCTKDGTSDGCGGTLHCGCTGGQVCDTQSKTCCTNKVCMGTGAAGDECGTFPSCGGSVPCKCSGAAYNTCGGGGVAGKCGCTPKMCPSNFTGNFDSGCGIVNCGGG